MRRHSRTPSYLCKVKQFDQICKCNDEVLSISDFSTNDKYRFSSEIPAGIRAHIMDALGFMKV
ncbi:hypothetical protein HanRHA438_Chr14g0637171 [Helianthus annuus]|uniref:Uncharacterized protein n=1 Tax=Helianthus annuus TaxID=4232 RepID=A0A9K3E627_HELAN|nr:hypothetical protein HanXRQr2_Chr14g0627351 [Helianthus annuus]KAJ0463182.1 hypothetical protein HanHA300_Chr14g0512341 [Helianthus annuus]KAJ0467054.1 hypothetical protein HanIR_Chr14g0678981 [Helianthus annuus]KAJ0484554.1 hypothetical protein HanHA89_Chr14g0545411 [Helianthus annuus]KAJ0655109.1 hypothetical protein HanLR1_Chr14g0514701 [Helianthus annuus]